MANRNISAVAGDLLEAVSATTSIFTRTIGTASNAVDALHYKSLTLREDARLQHLVDTASAEDRMKKALALKNAAARLELKKALSDPEMNTLYEEELKSVAEIFSKNTLQQN